MDPLPVPSGLPWRVVLADAGIAALGVVGYLLTGELLLLVGAVVLGSLVTVAALVLGGAHRPGAP